MNRNGVSTNVGVVTKGQWAGGAGWVKEGTVLTSTPLIIITLLQVVTQSLIREWHLLKW